MKRICSFLMAAAVALMGAAQSYVVMGRDGNVYDQPNSKGYVTTNMNGDDVRVLKGMVFRKVESSTGFDKIEYSPGINGFVLSSIEVEPASLRTPVAGIYPVKNAPGKNVTIENDGSGWSATLDGKRFAGINHDGVVVFYGNDSNPALSLVNLADGPVVISYDNTLTDFL